jgi:hypothetical protein
VHEPVSRETSGGDQLEVQPDAAPTSAFHTPAAITITISLILSVCNWLLVVARKKTLHGWIGMPNCSVGRLAGLLTTCVSGDSRRNGVGKGGKTDAMGCTPCSRLHERLQTQYRSGGKSAWHHRIALMGLSIPPSRLLLPARESERPELNEGTSRMQVMSLFRCT